MKGHSHGEWYPSADDIASSDDEAEYWAIFGMTRRGNMRCLGEFTTRQSAEDTLAGKPRGKVSPAIRFVDRVVCPMKEHSRGALQLSADDIARSVEDAGYWAILGLTADDRLYSLEEYETEVAADFALATWMSRRR